MRRTATGCATPKRNSPWPFSLGEALLVAQALMMPAPEAFPAGTLHICMPVCNRKTSHERIARRTRASDWRCGPSVSCNGTAGGVEDRFGERKLQYDLAIVVGHLDGSAQQRAIGTVG